MSEMKEMAGIKSAAESAADVADAAADSAAIDSAAADVAGLLMRLIGCQSVTPADGGALDLAAGILREAGFAVRRLPSGKVDNLWAADCDAPKILFAGHVDVVPPGDLALWKGDPFVAREEGGFVYGRGAADMKSGVAAMIFAAARLRKSGVGGVAVLLTSDEEGEAADGTRYVVEWRKKNGAPKIPFVVVGEPTSEKEFGDAIKTGRRGSLTARIAVRGVQTHAAYPHRGDNPIHKMVFALSEILRRAEKMQAPADENDNFPPLGVQVVKTESGVAENVIPAVATATINFRYAPRDDEKELRRMVESVLHAVAADSWTCEWRHGAAPFFSPPGVLAAALRESILSECGRRAALSVGGGTSDGRFLREIAGEIAEFGVVGETMHEANERVAKDAAPMLARVYEKTARILLSRGSG